VSRILLQTTIPARSDDWDVNRFSLLATELRAAGHEVLARNRSDEAGDDPVLAHLDDLDVDQLWLLAVDVGDGLTAAEADAVIRFREGGGGVLSARDHHRLGSCLLRLGSLGLVNRFHDESIDPENMNDDRGTPEISWPNFHSGANGDYQPVFITEPAHELMCTTRTISGRIEWFPAHPHEGLVTPEGPFATVVAQGRSRATGRRFNLAVALDGETAPNGRSMGRAVAESTFHHFADYNWDLSRGAPSFVSETPGNEISSDSAPLTVFKDYVRNLATWLQSPAKRYGANPVLVSEAHQ
jgi:hypothetical protein